MCGYRQGRFQQTNRGFTQRLYEELGSEEEQGISTWAPAEASNQVVSAGRLRLTLTTKVIVHYLWAFSSLPPSFSFF